MPHECHELCQGEIHALRCLRAIDDPDAVRADFTGRGLEVLEVRRASNVDMAEWLRHMTHGSWSGGSGRRYSESLRAGCGSTARYPYFVFVRKPALREG